MDNSQNKRPTDRLIGMAFVYPATFTPHMSGNIIIEVGPGRGDFLFHLAGKNPSSTVVGVEIKPKRVDKLIQRIEKRNLMNVMLIQDDARRALPRFFADSSVDEIHIQFPDPWPKKRHAKNRSVSEPFLSECARVLKCGGTLEFVTDFDAYATHVASSAEKVPSLCATETSDAVFPTFFAMKWKAEGKKFTCLKFVKK